MKKLLVLISIFILAMASSVLALDAPHNNTNSFGCGDCHSVTNPNDACLNCHNNFSGGGYTRLSAPGVLTHSSDNTSSTYGTWSQMCSDCHNPHVQAQRAFFGEDTWLVTGTITSVTRDIPANTTTYEYNSLNVLMPEWADPTRWGQKSKNERGLIIFPNIANVNLSAEILSATPTSITVTGYPGTVSEGSTFVLVYGQLISLSIRTPFGSTTAPLFTNTGMNSFAFDESGTSIDPNPNGVCQVCHSQTQHWRRDGTLAAIGIHAGQNGANCTQCHPHEEGFAVDCRICHDQGGGPVNGICTVTGGACTVDPDDPQGNCPDPNDECLAIPANNRHHLLVYGTIDNGSLLFPADPDVPPLNWTGDADNDGNNDTIYACENCHPDQPNTPEIEFWVTSDCLVCHRTGSPHQNVVFNGGDNCSDCHNNSNLSGSHLKHTDPDTILAGKTLSGGDFGNVTWWYQYSNTGGTPRAACGYCHPNTDATHINGITNLDFDPNEVGLPGGTLKGLNGSPPVFIQNTGVSVTCSSVYCHSTGYDDGGSFDYQTSPDWFGGVFIGDKCANCHGNSPNSGGKPGSLSHYNPDSYGMGIVGGHFVGIHYDNVFTGTTGLIQDVNSNNNAHGSAATSTTISCQVCHNGTVTTMANDQNTVCATCHGVGAIELQGDMIIAVASTTHINGQPDVVFMPGTVRSKAQIRDDITTVTELNDNWVRMNGYKLANSYDESSQPLNASAVYDSGTKTCSTVACHNGNQIEWGATNISCESCHMDLP